MLPPKTDAGVSAGSTLCRVLLLELVLLLVVEEELRSRGVKLTSVLLGLPRRLG